MACGWWLGSAVVRVACAKLESAIGAGDDAAPVMVGKKLMGKLVGMKESLESINQVLQEVDDRLMGGSRLNRMRLCMIRMKDAAYEIWDMVDDFQVNRSPAAAGRMVNRAKAILEELKAILDSFSGFRMTEALYDDEGRGETPPTTQIEIVEETVIIGMDEDKQSIVLDLLSASDTTQGPVILPIVGMGGAGKTTLAQMVFSDNRFKDYSKVWVCLSDLFDPDEIGSDLHQHEIGKSIISQLSKAECKDSNDMELITKRLHELLGGHKVLVVLDALRKDDPVNLERLKRMFSVRRRQEQ